MILSSLVAVRGNETGSGPRRCTIYQRHQSPYSRTMRTFTAKVPFIARNIQKFLRLGRWVHEPLGRLQRTNVSSIFTAYLSAFFMYFDMLVQFHPGFPNLSKSVNEHQHAVQRIVLGGLYTIKLFSWRPLPYHEVHAARSSEASTPA